MSRRRRFCVQMPESVVQLMATHLMVTKVSADDFVLLAIRNELDRQRANGLGPKDVTP